MSFISQAIQNSASAIRGNWNQLKPLELESLERHITDIATLALSVPVIAALSMTPSTAVRAAAALPAIALVATLHFALD